MLTSMSNAKWIVVGFVTLFVWATSAMAQAINTGYWYRLTNQFLGEGRSLDTYSDGKYTPFMGTTGNYSGQYWKLTPVHSGYYRLTNSFLGDCRSLDTYSGSKNTPFMGKTGRYSGQLWKLTRQGDGTYRLTNSFLKNTKSLDTSADDKNAPFMAKTGHYSGQYWKLTALEPIQSNQPIPGLNPKGSVYKTEGPTDYRIYLKAQGTLKAVMVFVDFPDVPAAHSSTQAVANHLLGDGKAQQLFNAQSYGKMSLQVTRVDGWQRMPQNASHYTNSQGLFSFDQHKIYIKAASALFPSVNFAAYDMVFIVAAQTDKISLSPAFNAYPGTGVNTGRGEIRLAVTFGNDSYSNRYINLVHEVGHLLGLPDLYRNSGELSIGPWGLMCDIFKGTSFIGWHRHKLGWLDADRKTFLKSGTLRTLITPLSGNCGTSMIVVPVGTDPNPEKVFVIEVVEPILGSDGKLWGEGVLIYSVDATLASLKNPVVIYPKKTGDSSVYGNLYQAPFKEGDHFQDNNAPMTVKIIEKVGNSYRLEVTRR